MFKKIILLLCLFFFCTLSFATSNGARPGHVATPAEGFVKTAVLMANGIVDPTQLVKFDLSYHTDARNRTPEQIEAHRALAIAHFENTFEIDVAELESQGRAFFSPFFMADEMQYRVYSLSDTWVPSSGFQIADGGWLLMITDPNGVTVNGNTVTPAGSMSVYGEYYILTENIAGKPQKPITVHYQSNKFMIFGVYGEAAILCDVFHPDWGWGRAQGINYMFPEGNGMNANIRNVFTFTGSDFGRPYHDVWFE